MTLTLGKNGFLGEPISFINVAIHDLFILYLGRFNTFNIKFAYDWIRTSDLWSCSTNWSSTTAHNLFLFISLLNESERDRGRLCLHRGLLYKYRTKFSKQCHKPLYAYFPLSLFLSFSLGHFYFSIFWGKSFSLFSKLKVSLSHTIYNSHNNTLSLT